MSGASHVYRDTSIYLPTEATAVRISWPVRSYSRAWLHSTKGESAIAIVGKQLTVRKPLRDANANKSTGGVDTVVIG